MLKGSQFARKCEIIAPLRLRTKFGGSPRAGEPKLQQRIPSYRARSSALISGSSLTATRGSGASSCISKNHLPKILQDIQFSANSSSVTWGLIPNANSLTCSTQA